jgi:MFS superfamily sulfate permease-like transporter
VLAAGTLLLLLFGTALLADIPSPAIGAIVGVAVLPLLGIRQFAQLWRLDRFEFAIGAVCFLATLFIGSIPGILVAFVLALINLAKRAASPAIDVLAADDVPTDSLLEDAPAGTTTAPGVIVVRMAAPLFFANGDVFGQAVKSAVTAAGGGDAVRHLVIDMEAVNDVDVTGAESFEGLRHWLEAEGVGLAFSRLRDAARPRLTRFGVLRDDPVFGTNRAAVAALATAESPTSAPQKKETAP